MSKKKKPTRQRPPQRQARQPGRHAGMRPAPVIDSPDYRAAGKLRGKVALITGGDSGIGAAVAIAFAKEGADVTVASAMGRRRARVTIRKSGDLPPRNSSFRRGLRPWHRRG